MPSAEDLSKGQYEFQHHESHDGIPHIEQSYFVHMMEHAEGHEGFVAKSSYLAQIPKRLFKYPSNSTNEGPCYDNGFEWGLEIRYGFDMSLCFSTWLAFSVLWMTLSVTWSLKDPHLPRARTLLMTVVMLSGLIFVALIMLCQMDLCYMKSRLEILSVFLSQRFFGTRFEGSGEVIHILQGEEYSMLNTVKIAIENLTGESWDWWPLNPSFRRLNPDKLRIRWCCVSEVALVF